MSFLEAPWIEYAIFAALLGALGLRLCVRDADVARRWCVAVMAAVLAMVFFGWLEQATGHVLDDHQPWSLVESVRGAPRFQIDQLNSPLLLVVSLISLLTVVASLRTQNPESFFSGALVSLALNLAFFASKEPWMLIVFLALGAVPVLFELKRRRQNARVFAIHMGLFVALLGIGWGLHEARGQAPSIGALLPLILALAIRCGLAPFHCWVTDLYDRATFGSAMAFTLPMPGAYAAVRLLVPVAPSWAFDAIGVLALITAVYAAGMGIVQRDTRRLFCSVFLSHSALVLVGLQSGTLLGLTAALSVWFAMIIALGGFGLVLRAIEGRCGRLSLDRFHGLYDHAPALAICFLLTGLASVGFPGAPGFVGAEMLVDAAVRVYPYFGVGVVVAAALNGIAVLQAYFRLFTGKRHVSSVPLPIRRREQFAVLMIVTLILVLGLAPQPGIASRYRAAEKVLQLRPDLPSEPVAARPSF